MLRYPSEDRSQQKEKGKLTATAAGTAAPAVDAAADAAGQAKTIAAAARVGGGRVAIRPPSHLVHMARLIFAMGRRDVGLSR